jgi:hypothetical protein
MKRKLKQRDQSKLLKISSCQIKKHFKLQSIQEYSD